LPDNPKTLKRLRDAGEIKELYGFEALLYRAFTLCSFSNGFARQFDFVIIKEFSEEFFYLDRFEVLQLLRSIET
jgi:hypothetical protein